MEIIGLFCPAIVSLMIWNRRSRESDWRMPNVLFK